MPGSPLVDFAKRHKNDFPASVGTGRPQPCSTAGETEAERGPGQNPPVWRLCPQNTRILPKERSLRSRGWQPPPSRRAPAQSSFAAGFWHSDRPGKKKIIMNILAGNQASPRGRILDDGDVFCPNFFLQPHATAGGVRSPATLCRAGSPCAQTRSSGCCSSGLPGMVLWRDPLRPQGPEHQAEPWSSQSHLPPRVPLTFRHPWSSSSFSWLTRPGFLQMEGRVWLHGLSFHLPSCTVGRKAGLSLI